MRNTGKQTHRRQIRYTLSLLLINDAVYRKRGLNGALKGRTDGRRQYSEDDTLIIILAPEVTQYRAGGPFVRMFVRFLLL